MSEDPEKDSSEFLSKKGYLDFQTGKQYARKIYKTKSHTDFKP